MRTRQLLLPALTATLLAVAGAPTSAPAAAPAPNPCAPHEIPMRGRGLDGGIGCHDPRKPEPPAEMVAAREVFGGTRSAADGAERLAALRQAQAMRAAAEAERARTGARDFTTASGAPVADSATPWRALGPSPLIVNDPEYPGGEGYGVDKVAGRTTALVVDPKDASGNTVYMGAAAGGVWKTTDAGAHWVSIGDDLPSQAVGALALNDDGWLFAGLGEGNTGSDNYAGAGLVVTKDGGATWSDPLGAGVIPEGVVSTRISIVGDTILYGTHKGLFRSTDNGTTWTRALLPTAGAGQESEKAFGNFVTDVRFQPGTTDVALAVVGWRSGGIGAAAGLYRTTDAGASWAKVGEQTFGKTGGSTSADPIGRTTLAYAAGEGQDHDVVYALIQDPGWLNNEPFPTALAVPAQANTNNLNGLYRSADNGDTWTLVADNLDFGTAVGSGISTTNLPVNGNYGPGVQAWYNQYVEVDPTLVTAVVNGVPVEAERVIVGLEEIYQGEVIAGAVDQWQTIGRYWNACIQVVLVQLDCSKTNIPGYQGLTTHADQHAAAFAVTDGGVRLYAGNDGGVYRQDAGDNGYTNDAWTSLNDTLNTTQPYAATMGSDGVVYAGLQDNGTIRIGTDGVANEVIGGDGFDVAVDPEDSDIAYEEYANGILRVTTNGGVSWSGDVSPTDATGMRFSTPFELDPTDPEHFVYAGSQVWENVNAPSLQPGNWVNVFDLTNPENAPAAAATAIDVEGAVTYAAWCGLPASPPAKSSACNITTGDGHYDPTLFRRGIATNAGSGCKPEKASTECWHQAQSNGLPNRFIQGIEIDPNDPKTVYVAVASFSRHWTYDPASFQPGVVFKSTDAGATFKDITGNMPQTFGSDVLVVGDRLLASTDVGVFATPLADPGEWVPFGTNIPAAVPAIEISTDPQQETVVLATHGRGVWVLDLTGKKVRDRDKGEDKDKDDDRGNGTGGNGQTPATGLPGWVPFAALPLIGGAAGVRRRLRAARE